jgi:hypothetical protein
MIAELSVLFAGHRTTEAQFSARHPENPRSLIYAVQETYNFINCILFLSRRPSFKENYFGKANVYTEHDLS